MSTSSVWVLVADAARARVYHYAPADNSIVEIDHMARTNELPASGDILADRPGRTFESANATRHAMEPTSDPHRELKRQFANVIADALAHDQQAGAFGQLMIFAPPSFLGDLRNAMPDKLRQAVRAEVDKDLTKLPVIELPARIAEAFRP